MLQVARLLELLLSADLARLLLSEAVLAPARARGAVPFEGWERVAFHGTQGLFLAWPFGCAWLAWRLFDEGWRWAWIAIPSFGFACVELAHRYPSLRGESLASWYRGTHASCIALALLSIPVSPARVRIGGAHLASLLLLAGLGAELAGPWLGDPFGSWSLAQVTWTIVLAAVAVAALGRRPWGISAAP